MIFSKSSGYALHASLYLADQKSGDFISIRKICEDLNISFSYLTKVLQKMSKFDLVITLRGSSGGVRLARPSDQIFLKQIIVAIDGDQFFTGCVLGFPSCGEAAPCPLHNEWKVIRQNLDIFFSQTSLQDLILIEQYKRKKFPGLLGFFMHKKKTKYT